MVAYVASVDSGQLEYLNCLTLAYPLESWSHDITSCLTSAPLASVPQCNLSFRISFSGLSEKTKHVPGVYFPYSKTNQDLLQYLLLEIETFVILTKFKQRLLCEHRKKVQLHGKNSTHKPKHWTHLFDLMIVLDEKLRNQWMSVPYHVMAINPINAKTFL